jgi:hypothetical protein
MKSLDIAHPSVRAKKKAARSTRKSIAGGSAGLAEVIPL